MKYAEANKIFNYPISFVVDGELVSPDSATITVLQNDGTVADSINEINVTVPFDVTRVTYPISSAANSANLTSNLRFVEVKFTYEGIEYAIKDYYQIVSGINVPVNEQDVRNLLGMTESEMPDNAINILAAYSELDNFLEDVDLGNIISTGSSLILPLQKAVKNKAAMDCALMLELLIFQSEQADNTVYKRFTNFDFKDLYNRLRLNISEALTELRQIDDPEQIAYFTVFTDADPITGA
jgi:hypothetical protein